MTGIIILIVLGILLFVIEFLLVPGITVAGIGGLALTILGVYKAFATYGNTVGIWVLIGTIALSLLVIIFSLRAKTWSRLMLKTNINSTVDKDLEEDQIKSGDKGVAMTRLAPMGKVKVNNLVREAKSMAGYIDERSDIVVVSVDGTRIVVKPLKE